METLAAPTIPEKITRDWHELPAEEVMRRLASNGRGLTSAEAQTRLATYGKNVLPGKKKITLAQIILHQLISPFIYILAAAMLISFLTGDYTDAGFIGVVILINVALGTYQEWRSEKSAQALQQLLKVSIRVKRNGAEILLPGEELVPGDIVLLESGNKVPADLRIILSNNLTVDESFLTGESIPVVKQVAPVTGEKVALAERNNLAFAGSTVINGRGTGIVVATGARTEVGKLSEAVVSSAEAKTPLVLRMERFARQVSYIVMAACAVLLLIGFLQGKNVADMFFLVVALAVSAIPEGLPISMTVALSVSINRMIRRNVIVRKLTAVEGLGSCTAIATDKTGTLTVNQQTVKRLVLPDGTAGNVSGEGYEGRGEITAEPGQALSKHATEQIHRLARTALICNEGQLTEQAGQWLHLGDSVDVALLALGYKAGVDVANLPHTIETLAEIPFESERMYSAKVYRENGAVKVAVKGAAEALLPRCRTMQGMPLNVQQITEQIHALSENGYRVIAVAGGTIAHFSPADLTDPEKLIHSLDFLGLTGLIDPLRPEVAEAVQKSLKAGVRVIMITGDHPRTALAIGKSLGIAQSGEQVISGTELEQLSGKTDEEYAAAVQHKSIFARVTPLQKLQIVDALIKAGEFVAVTGDGVNDAPALKRANIGVAMGSGTDVAKDTASIIVKDDNFASIVAGIEEGRTAYNNIRKVVYLLISTGASEILLFFYAFLFGTPIPLTAIQVLWLNLVTNGIQDKALSLEKGKKNIMKQKPRNPREGIFNPLMYQQTIISGLVISLMAFGCFYFLYQQGYDEWTARNMTLLVMVSLQNFHLFNCRSEFSSTFRVPLSGNYYLLAAVALAQGVHVAAMHLPITQRILHVQPVSLPNWITAVALASAVLIAMELFKLVKFGTGRSGNLSIP